MRPLLPLSLLLLSPLALSIPTLAPLPNRHTTLTRSSILSRANSTALSNGAPIARAGGTLNAAAAAEANPRDATAERAFSSTAIKAATGDCLAIDPAGGDFRQNLIPVQLKPCDGGANQRFDVVTKGKHDDQAGTMLVVSAATQGCLNFDPRRKAGDQVLLFSCGGRADGGGAVTDSQLFAFAAGKTSLQLAPQNAKGATCLVPVGGKLGSAACGAGADQVFSIG